MHVYCVSAPCACAHVRVPLLTGHGGGTSRVYVFVNAVLDDGVDGVDDGVDGVPP